MKHLIACCMLMMGLGFTPASFGAASSTSHNPRSILPQFCSNRTPEMGKPQELKTKRFSLKEWWKRAKQLRKENRLGRDMTIALICGIVWLLGSGVGVLALLLNPLLGLLGLAFSGLFLIGGLVFLFRGLN